ncbi:type II secretion system protein GspI, partial [Xanthomonas perforans]
MRHLANARASSGFSLLELIVALAIFGIAVVGLLNLSSESTRTAVVLEEHALAAVVAENQAIEATLAPAAAIRAPANGQ